MWQPCNTSHDKPIRYCQTNKTQCTTVTKQLFGQGQSDHVPSLLMLACYLGATASAPNVKFIVK